MSKNYRKILLVDRSEEAIRIARSEEGEIFRESGPATPDMLIRTKYDYLYVTGEEDPGEKVREYSEKYEKEYKTYIKEFPMHDPFPSIILIRGFGIVTAARTYRECSIIRDQFIHSMRVNSVAEKLGKHSFISRKEAFDMEYWPLEEAKLKKFKPRKLEGTVSIVTGAANGIGLEAFRKLAANGSNVVGADKEKSISDKNNCKQ